jgi:hypothetical protein
VSAPAPTTPVTARSVTTQSVTTRPVPSTPGLAARLGRLVAVVLVFVVLGPPLGAVIWIGILAGLSIPPDWDAAEPGFTWFTVLGLIYAVPMSYFFGTAPAAAAGLVIGLVQSFIGRARWPLALGTGLVVAVVVVERSGEGTLAATPGQGPFPEYSAVMILACLASNMLCWVLVRSWYVAPPPSKGVTP